MAWGAVDGAVSGFNECRSLAKEALSLHIPFDRVARACTRHGSWVPTAGERRAAAAGLSAGVCSGSHVLGRARDGAGVGDMVRRRELMFLPLWFFSSSRFSFAFLLSDV